jgi:hypothetical protein
MGGVERREEEQGWCLAFVDKEVWIGGVGEAVFAGR